MRNRIHEKANKTVDYNIDKIFIYITHLQIGIVGIVGIKLKNKQRHCVRAVRDIVYYMYNLLLT